MPEFIEIDGLLFTEGTLRVATEEYLDFRESEKYGEEYKWKIVEELQEWLESHEITTETIEELVDLIEELQPRGGPLVDWRQIQRLREFVDEDPTRAATALQDLLYGDDDLEGRLSYFRDLVPLGTDCLSLLITARDPSTYAPYKDSVFRDFLDIFHEGEVPSLGGVTDKLVLYGRVVREINRFFDRANLVDNPEPLHAQDFMYIVTQFPEARADTELALLQWVSTQLGGYKEDPQRFLEVIRDLPDAFLEDQMETYADRGKVARIRYQVIQAALQDTTVDLEGIKEQEKERYEKDILRRWDDFSILGQIYYNLFKHRVDRTLKDLVDFFADELGIRNTKTHIVSFQGPRNFVSPECWFALYPVDAESHREAYQLFLGLKPDGAEVGLIAGDHVQPDPAVEEKLVREKIPPHEVGVEEILERLKDLQPVFQELTQGEAEESEAPEHREIFDEIAHHLTRKGQVILSGPPGTGKTYLAHQFGEWWTHDQTDGPVSEGQLRTVTFHPSFSYEDFLEGLTAKPKDGTLTYEIQDGLLKKAAKEAQEAYEATGEDEEAPPYVLVLDEINRGNLPRILGETVTLLEFDKRLGRENETSIELAHSGEPFTLPPNLYLIGTMNTADRSIALIDAAIQRRFRTIPFPPDYEVLFDEFDFEGRADAEEAAGGESDRLRALQALSILALEHLNTRIRNSGSLGKGKQIGHSYLLGDSEIDDLVGKWKNDIFPLLEDYYFGEISRVQDEIFDGGGDALFDWERQRVKDFDEEDLIETFRSLLSLPSEEEGEEA